MNPSSYSRLGRRRHNSKERSLEVQSDDGERILRENPEGQIRRSLSGTALASNYQSGSEVLQNEHSHGSNLLQVDVQNNSYPRPKLNIDSDNTLSTGQVQNGNNSSQSERHRNRSGSWNGADESEDELAHVPRSAPLSSPLTGVNQSLEDLMVPSINYESYQNSMLHNQENNGETDSANCDCYDEDRIKRNLKFFFMNPIEKWHAKKRLPWKLVVQIIKIIICTIQLCLFASQRYSHVTYLWDTKVSLSHLFIKGWDTSREVTAYPPANGPLAIYEIQDFYDFIDYSVDMFSTVEKTSIGAYKYDKEGNEVILPSFCFSEYVQQTLEGGDNRTYVVSNNILKRCVKIPSVILNGTKEWSIKDYLSSQNMSINFDLLVDSSYAFNLKTTKMKSDYPFDCFEFLMPNVSWCVKIPSVILNGTKEWSIKDYLSSQNMSINFDLLVDSSYAFNLKTTKMKSDYPFDCFEFLMPNVSWCVKIPSVILNGTKEWSIKDYLSSQNMSINFDLLVDSSYAFNLKTTKMKSDYPFDCFEFLMPNVSWCVKIPSVILNGTKEWSIKDYLSSQNMSINFDLLVDSSYAFNLKTTKMKSDYPFDTPECYSLETLIYFDNSDHDGQMLVELDIGAKVLDCKPSINPVGRNAYLESFRSVLNLLTIVVCLLSFVMCFRAIFRAQSLRVVVNNYFKSRFLRELTLWEKLEFFNFWYALICFSDFLNILGSIIKMGLESQDYEGYLDKWNFCSLLLGTGNLFIWFGCLRYLGFFETYNVLILTIKKCFPNVLRYSICIMMVFAGYSFCGWLVLGPYHIKFRSFSATIECLYSLINGDDMFATFSSTIGKDTIVWWFSRIYLYTFISLFIYVILSLFIAIITDAYDTIKRYYEVGFPLDDLKAFANECQEDPRSGVFHDEERTMQDWINYICCCCPSLRRLHLNSRDFYEPIPT